MRIGDFFFYFAGTNFCDIERLFLRADRVSIFAIFRKSRLFEKQYFLFFNYTIPNLSLYYNCVLLSLADNAFRQYSVSVNFLAATPVVYHGKLIVLLKRSFD